MRLQHAFIAGLILMVPGCAGRDIMVQKQAEMEARLEYLIQMDNALSLKVASLADEVKKLDGQVRANSATTRNPGEEAGSTGSGTKFISPNGELLTRQTFADKIELINTDTAAREASDGASASYMKAFGLYSENKYPAAITAFNEFLDQYPDNEYAANARYWIGECHYSQSDLPKALEAFTEAVRKHPDGKKAPDALLKIGYTLYAMKKPDQARATLSLLIEKFPDNPAAAKAREKLDKN